MFNGLQLDCNQHINFTYNTIMGMCYLCATNMKQEMAGFGLKLLINGNPNGEFEGYPEFHDGVKVRNNKSEKPRITDLLAKDGAVVY